MREYDPFVKVRMSLADITGNDYIRAVCRARNILHGDGYNELMSQARSKVDFYPRSFHRETVQLLGKTGIKLAAPLRTSACGATTANFAANTHTALSPVNGFGPFRFGENGRLYLISKSEHYHASLGHDFPGYSLLHTAAKLGITNITHNNTRGHITRLMEEELVMAANGADRLDESARRRILCSKSPSVINRVINLETGSLAMEAAVKLLLSRFYKIQEDSASPAFRGKTPVFLVMGNDDGGLLANYHGTSLLTQTMRGMWGDFQEKMEKAGVIMVRCVRPNNIADVDAAFSRFNKGKTRIAGFLHELVMMNYGARLLHRSFIRHVYARCRENNVPVVVDEIQSCAWSPQLFMFREYGVKPAMIAVGKGFPGGLYASSRLLFSSAYDSLPQFGALVTNGQEELAALAYLITMKWVTANAGIIHDIGCYYEERLRALVGKYPQVASVEGRRHLTGINMTSMETARNFIGILNRKGIDISIQSYKTSCPPCALTKIPLTSGYELVDFLVSTIEDALSAS